jgi:osmotically-inducible protein OsmY
MNKKFAVGAVFVLLFAMACGSMNRATPKQWDATTMEADVRSEVARAVPSKTFAIEVKIDDHKVVTLSGHAANEADRKAIGEAAGKVNGVTSVINNIHVE